MKNEIKIPNIKNKPPSPPPPPARDIKGNDNEYIRLKKEVEKAKKRI